MSIGSRIKEARLAKKYTQNQLAKKMGLSRQAVSNHESDKRKPDPLTIGSFADALDVEPNFLLQDYCDSQNPPYSLKTLVHAKRYDKLDQAGRKRLDYQLACEEKRMSGSYSGNDYIYIPLYPDISSFDGHLEALYQPILDTLENCMVGFIAAMPDDSMKPDFEYNDLLMFERTDCIRNKETGIFLIGNDKLVIRRLKNNFLCSSDPHEKPITFDTNITCLGRYIRIFDQKKK